MLEDFEGIAVEDGYLIVRVKASENPRPSSTGKTYLLYTTGKAKQMSDMSYVQLTWYKYPPR
ncbi:MAG: hypothetical protein ACTSPI_10555 [Candidatus Heimdallarchaeaceae archaeon]